MPDNVYPSEYVAPFVNGDTSQMGRSDSPTTEEQEARAAYVEKLIEKRQRQAG